MPGPYVQVAAFVESTSQDTSGKLSLFGIFDKITASWPANTSPLPPGEEMAVLHQCYLVVAIKGGGWSGRSELRILRERDAADAEPWASHPFTMPDGPDAGVNLIARIERPFILRRGLNWFRVLVGSNELTRIPLSLDVTQN